MSDSDLFLEYYLLSLDELLIDNHLAKDVNYVILMYNYINFTFNELVIDKFVKSFEEILKTKYRNHLSLYTSPDDFYSDFKSILIANIDILVNAMLITEMQLTIEEIGRANAVTISYQDNRGIDKLYASSVENFRKTAETPTEISAIESFVDSYTNFQEKLKTDTNVSKDNTKDDRTGSITQSNTSTFVELFDNIENLKFGYINKLITAVSSLFISIYNY